MIPKAENERAYRHEWAIVLAAGDGVRLRSVTTGANGVPIPKQFCSLVGEQTMLQMALERAWRLVPREQVVVIVAEQHRPWWARELEGVPEENILVQPRNRGTAPGIFFPLLHVALADPLARVAVVPSDHYIAQEGIVRDAFRQALDEVAARPSKLVLLGMTPAEADSGYGWIVPAQGERGQLPDVASFVEKPGRDEASRLMREGALWSSFMLAAAAGTLLRLYSRVLPGLVAGFLRACVSDQEGWEPKALAAVYEDLSTSDFSRDLLQQVAAALKVLGVPACGWTDLGTPARLAQCVHRAWAAGMPPGTVGSDASIPA